MSLQIWLPLDGSLENKGLEQNYKIEKKISANTSSTELISKTQSGKITAKSYLWENEGQAISINGYMNKLKTYSTYSISAWVYYTQPSAHSLAICSSGNWNDSARKFNFVLYNYSNGGYTHVIVPSLAYWNSDCVALDTPIQPNQWYHICITCDTIHTKIYINGQLQSNYHTCAGNTITTDPENENLFIGGATYWYQMTIKGSINDFRIYDHCLSPREIKLLAQGLVTHYKLNDPYLESTTNLLNGVWTHTNFWNAPLGIYSALSTQLNGGACEVVEFNNIKCLRFQVLSGEEQGRVFSTYPIKANTTYTVSLDYYASSTHYNALKVELNGGDYYWTPSSCSYSTLNQWKRLSITVTPTSDTTLYIFAYGNINEYAYINNIQLEEKDHATPYTPSSRNNNIAYDCSGYNNHGTASASFETSIDSPRYSHSTLFKDDKYIQTSFTGHSGLRTIYSIVYWAKMEAGANEMNGKMAWGFYNSTTAEYLDIYPQSGKLTLNAGGGEKPNLHFGTSGYTYPTDGMWHHYALVSDGAVAYLYVDGDYKGAANADNSTITTYPIPNAPLVLSGWNTSETSTFGWNNGHISDFRLYATALSAAAVKEIYQSSISFLDNGTLQCSEIVEKPTNLKYNKNGIVQTAKIEEANTNLKLYNDKIQTFQIYEL